MLELDLVDSGKFREFVPWSCDRAAFLLISYHQDSHGGGFREVVLSRRVSRQLHGRLRSCAHAQSRHVDSLISPLRVISDQRFRKNTSKSLTQRGKRNLSMSLNGQCVHLVTSRSSSSRLVDISTAEDSASNWRDFGTWQRRCGYSVIRAGATSPCRLVHLISLNSMQLTIPQEHARLVQT